MEDNRSVVAYGRSPTIRLLAGLAVTLSAVAIYSAYTVAQLRSLQEIQATTIDRNRTDSLLLLRIQNNLNSLGLGMRDMLEKLRRKRKDALERYDLGGVYDDIAQELRDIVDTEREALDELGREARESGDKRR